MSVSDVLNGLIYLLLSFTTRVDAVWRVLLPFKSEGYHFLFLLESRSVTGSARISYIAREASVRLDDFFGLSNRCLV